MDNNLLEKQLQEIITTYHASNIRYKHFAVSSKEMSVLPQLSLSFRKLLPDYHFWNGNEIEADNTPSALCSRKEFIDATFKQTHQGIIIYRPDFWFQHWNIADKQAFWSALATRQDEHHVIVIFAESDEFQRLNINYLSPKPLENLPITLWVSSKKQLF